MKKKIYLLLLVSFIFSDMVFYLPMNSLNFFYEIARNDMKDTIYAQNTASNEITQWMANGTVICNETTAGQSSPRICSDGAGGAIIAWMDKRNGNYDIYAQKTASNGITQWTANGTAICNEVSTDQLQLSSIISDGAGGAIIAWQDSRTGSTDIYVQKIASNGTTLWTANGTVICNETTAGQYSPRICSDGAGGAIIAWDDSRNGMNEDIYAQKIASNGITSWTANGTVICNETTADQNKILICSDGAGGAIIAWADLRNGNDDIYVQKIASNGSSQWMANGTVICNEAPAIQYSSRICSDGAGGAIFVWHDSRNGNYDVYAQKIVSNGSAMWAANGTVICNEATEDQKFTHICSDGVGGAIIAWQDTRSGNYDVYMQKIGSDGNTLWMANGTVICNIITEDTATPGICSDGAGGAIIAWVDNRTGNYDIYTQWIASNGTCLWTANGTVICNIITEIVGEESQSITILSDGTRGAIIAWEDYRNGLNYDIYAQKIKTVNGNHQTLPTPDDDDDNDGDDDDKGLIPGYDLYLIFGLLLLCGLISVIVNKKKITN